MTEKAIREHLEYLDQIDSKNPKALSKIREHWIKKLNLIIKKE